MAYVLEEITTPEQRAELAKYELQSPFTSGPADVSEWLVDRKRGLYLINLGGGIDKPYFLVFADRNAVLLQVEGWRRGSGLTVPKGVDETWTIESVPVQRYLAKRIPEILKEFRRALVAYGSLGDATIARSVTVKLGPTRLI